MDRGLLENTPQWFGDKSFESDFPCFRITRRERLMNGLLPRPELEVDNNCKFVSKYDLCDVYIQYCETEYVVQLFYEVKLIDVYVLKLHCYQTWRIAVSADLVHSNYPTDLWL